MSSRSSLRVELARFRQAVRAVDLTPPVTRLLMKAGAFRDCRRGAGATEYALLAGLIALAIISAVGVVGSAVSRTVLSAIAKLYPHLESECKNRASSNIRDAEL